MKHTPGPWTYGRNNLCCDYFAFIVTAIHAERGVSNVLIGGQTEHHPPRDEAEANAALIAAAPELLAALKQMTSSREPWAASDIAALIAKAEGLA